VDGVEIVASLKNIHEKISSLTNSFNAFDTRFCEVFNHYNLTATVDWWLEQFVHMRHFFVRDDLTSSFPPDANAVFYESPGITFIVLKEPATTWGNIFYPFEHKIWVGVILSFFIVFFSTFVFSKVSRSFLNYNLLIYFIVLTNLKTYTERVWILFVKIFSFFILSAYSGMILSGYLFPRYLYTPKTFKELNSTDNFIVASSLYTGVYPNLLKDNFILNGIKNWVTHFNNTLVLQPGRYLEIDENDVKNRYAVMMYSDKKDLYISSREQLLLSYRYIHNLHSNNEVVLREMRYISIAPGATKFHFLLKAIKRNFECGVWFRWKHLEENYIKFVAPLIAQK
jgi:hypothetical protein